MKFQAGKFSRTKNREKVMKCEECGGKIDWKISTYATKDDRLLCRKCENIERGFEVAVIKQGEKG